MKVQSISSQNFEAKKFRLPIKNLVDKAESGHEFPKFFKTPVNLVKEYSNPNAEAIYKEAMSIKDPFKRAEKLSEMGDYEIKDMSWKARLRRLWDKITMDVLW